MIANYRDAIEYLNNKQSLGIKPGLERIIKCLESLTAKARLLQH